MPSHPAKGAGRKGIAKFQRFPAVGRESCDLNCTGREPSLAGRATTGFMARKETKHVSDASLLTSIPQRPDGAEGKRSEPEGFECAFWWVRIAHSCTGQPF